MHDGKYYIQSQNDLYQVDELAKFAFPQAWILVWVFQFWATIFCVTGAVLLWPVSAVEQWAWEQGRGAQAGDNEGLLAGIEMRELGNSVQMDEVRAC